MKITLDLSPVQADVLLAFCVRLNATPPTKVIDLAELQRLARVLEPKLAFAIAEAEMQGTAEMDARVGLPPAGQS